MFGGAPPRGGRKMQLQYQPPTPPQEMNKNDSPVSMINDCNITPAILRNKFGCTFHPYHLWAFTLQM